MLSSQNFEFDSEKMFYRKSKTKCAECEILNYNWNKTPCPCFHGDAKIEFRIL